MNWIIPLSLLVIFEIFADIFAKEWSLKPESVLWIGAITCYVIANAFWLFALKNGSGLGRGAVIFSVSSAIIATLIGIFWYKEMMTAIQLTGVFLGIVSLIFIFW